MWPRALWERARGLPSATGTIREMAVVCGH
jgi:hypothetical protein